MDQLVFYESRAAAADPHRDMRLDIDNMSYEARSACILLQLPCSGNLKIFFQLIQYFVVLRTCWLWENLWAMSTQAWPMRKFRSA
jgi:hypothetical protein